MGDCRNPARQRTIVFAEVSLLIDTRSLQYYSKQENVYYKDITSKGETLGVIFEFLSN